MAVIDLRALQNAVAGKVELDDGVHDVRKANVEQYQRLMTFAQIDGVEALAQCVAIVAELMPTVPVAVIHKFPPDVVRMVVTLATQGVEAVQAHFPNADSPETSTSPGSSP